ncbi:uncharacterized protein [Panulirus ornatus]|uniref:uncharacterized protein n=1 Tax=Panulirus ornatus TaxID=150431 RepID=UPI003A8BCB54
MNALVVISACICLASGLPQYYPYSAGYVAQPYAAVAPYAAAPTAHVTYDYNIIPDTAEAPPAPGQYVVAPPLLPTEYKGMHHSQDELGQFAFGHTSLHQAHNAVRDFTGAVQGTYTYIDADGNEVIANYIADQDGFRVSSNALPVAPVFEGEAPVAPEFKLEAPVFDLEAPVFDLEAPVFDLEQVEDTPEVAAAREEHFRLVEEHKAVVAAALAAAAAEETAETPAEEEPAEETITEAADDVTLAEEVPVAEEATLAEEVPLSEEAPLAEEIPLAEEEQPAAVVEEEPAPAEETTVERRRKRQVLIPQFYRALPVQPLLLNAESTVEGAVGMAALRDAEVLRIVHNPNHGTSYRLD